MNAEAQTRFACSEEFAELCALSTTGALTTEERALLDVHLASCERCRAVLADYKSLTSDGMAKLAGVITDEWVDAQYVWAQPDAKSRILRKFAGGEPARSEDAEIVRKSSAIGGRVGIPSVRGLVWLLSTAALVLMGVLLGYQFGSVKGLGQGRLQGTAAGSGSSTQRQMAELQAQRDALTTELAANSKAVTDLKERSQRAEKELIELTNLKVSLDDKTERLSSENQQQADSLGSVSAQRDDLQRKLLDTQQSLQNVRDSLNRLEQERQKTLLRTASLETRIGELTSELHESKGTVQRQQDFLASDRDIRDLMGARQLYIADVFDVDHNGKKRKSFGRIFYTRGKSLIFYGFDLDQQPAYRNANAFQVWGSPSEDQSRPVSLGVFYMDNELNRRWVFKSDDPEVLAQINAVFVTVEPNGESKTPSGKPFLYAYLRTAPANHP
jgi:hypothetical protein